MATCGASLGFRAAKVASLSPAHLPDTDGTAWGLGEQRGRRQKVRSGEQLWMNNVQVAVLSLRGRESVSPSSGPPRQAACPSPWRQKPGDEKADRCACCGSSWCPDGTGTCPEGFGTGNVSGKRVLGSTRPWGPLCHESLTLGVCRAFPLGKCLWASVEGRLLWRNKVWSPGSSQLCAAGWGGWWPAAQPSPCLAPRAPVRAWSTVAFGIEDGSVCSFLALEIHPS